jgi:hypothetical protein
MFKKIIPFILLIIVVFPILLPLFNNGFFSMHDDTQPSRVFVMANALKDNQIPVRWVSGLGYGYGYPIFNYYAPLPYYFGAFFVLFGLNIFLATKLMFGFPIILAAFSMYILGKKFWGNFGGLLSSILYSYAPYHAIEIYIRGAVGEYWAYALLPLIFYGVIETQINYKKGIFIGSICFALLILSHNILAFILSLFLGLWIFMELCKLLFIKSSKNFLVPLLKIIFLGLILSAFFWIPAIFEMNLTKAQLLNIGSNDYHLHFVYLEQLWNSVWGFAGSAPGQMDGMSFKIGKIHLLLGLISILLLLFGLFIDLEGKYIYKKIILLIGFVFSTFLMLSISTKIWEVIPFMSFVQYPWRFLVMSVFFISLLAGGIFSIDLLSKIYIFKLIIFFICVSLIIGYNLKLFKPQYIIDVNENVYISNQNLKWNISKISDEYLPKYFVPPKVESEVKISDYQINDDIIIEQNDVKTNFIKLNVFVKKTAEIIFFRTYYPGWKVVIDKNDIKPNFDNGFITIQVPEGKHIITLFLENTLIQKIANFISLIGIIIIWVIFLKYKYEK